MTDRPNDEGAMFFVGMKFAPTQDLKQSDLNKLVVNLFSRYFIKNGEVITTKHPDNSMLSLVQFLVDLDFTLNEEAFSEVPEELRKLFMVKHRDGTEHRYGQKPRW
jgi:hypothetical protein